MTIRPGLTLAVLVKNDAERLRRCLESANGTVDEVVVLDTGSTDDTREVASALGARVERIEWPGAFDKAVNALLDLVETEWTLRLDSDEWMLPGTQELYREHIADEEAQGYALLRLDPSESGGFTEVDCLRLWRTHPAMRVTGVVHEQFRREAIEAASEGRVIKPSEIRFGHDGYIGPVGREKNLRNLRLIEEELRIRPGQLYYEIKLALGLLHERDASAPARVQKLADKIVKSAERPDTPTVPDLLAVAIDLVGDSQLLAPRTERLIDAVWEWYDRSPLPLWSMGVLMIRRDDVAGAYEAFRRIDELAQSGDYDRGTPVDPFILGPGTLQNLVKAAETLGDAEAAARYRERLAVYA